MPDLFDNFFGKVGKAVNGKSNSHYSSNSQVNTGRYYSYHNTGTNNNYWMPTSKKIEDNIGDMKEPTDTDMRYSNRMGSVSSNMSMDSDMNKSRNSSVSE